MALSCSPDSKMAQTRQSDGINMIFDERSPASCRSQSCSRSSSSCSSHTSRHSRGRSAHRGRHRSPSSSSNSRSTSPSSRSRSHPRCHRHSSRCRCSNHYRYQRGHLRRSPPRHYQAHSRSYSRSPSVDRYYHRRHNWSRSRSSSYRSRYSYSRASKYRCQFSRSPPRSFRSRSRSRPSERSIALSVEEKRQLLQAATQNAMKNLGVHRLELPESIRPILMQHSVASEPGFTGQDTRVRRDSRTTSQSTRVEDDDAQSPRLSPKRGISFSTNNSVAKPAVCTQSFAKVTSLMDSVEGKKPYGHWIPVKSTLH